MKSLIWFFFAVFVTGCALVSTKNVKMLSDGDKNLLSSILASQEEASQSRYSARNPLKTLSFFQIAPGETVVEFLPGGGWYSKILLPYLGSEGRLIGVDYPVDIWQYFPFGSDEFIAQRKSWPSNWVKDASQWGGPASASVSAYTVDSLPSELSGQVDTVLFIRAMHNLARFDGKGSFLQLALKRTFEVLKPGGKVGIVQHAVSESYDDAWADGSKGYLKASFIKSVMKEAGFEFVAETDINVNPLDRPGPEDSVWRLPPSLATSQNDVELKAKMIEIGESNRATLLFRKPK